MGLILLINYSKPRFFNLAIASSAARLSALEVATALCHCEWNNPSSDGFSPLVELLGAADRKFSCTGSCFAFLNVYQRVIENGYFEAMRRGNLYQTSGNSCWSGAIRGGVAVEP
jgi:hypothetical protein